MAPTLNFLAAIVAAVAYGIAGYAKNLAADPTTKFSPLKMLTTTVLSIVVGLIMYFVGIDVTADTFLLYSTAYGFLTVMIEQILKGLNNKYHFL